jgi:signal recognition particle GTPase
VKGRVILDYESFIEANPQYDIALFHTVEGSRKIDVDKDDDSSFWSDTEDEDDHDEGSAATHQVYIGSKIIRGAIFRSYTKEEFILDELDQLQALLCPPTSAGFSLTDKVWGFFDIDKTRDIRWRNNMLNDVEIDPTYKRALSDLVKYHFSSSSETNNVLANKGKALIMLLYGAPGCGKTATAGKGPST